MISFGLFCESTSIARSRYHLLSRSYGKMDVTIVVTASMASIVTSFLAMTTITGIVIDGNGECLSTHWN